MRRCILDVRLPEDVDALPRLLPTSRVLPHGAVAALSDPPGRAIVVCMRGRKLSEGAAALLRAKGWQAEVLEGGAEAWAAAGLPMIPRGAAGPTLALGHPPPPEDRPHRLPMGDPPLRRPRRALSVRRSVRSRGRCRAIRRHPLRHRRRGDQPPGRPLHLRRACLTTSPCTPRRWTVWHWWSGPPTPTGMTSPRRRRAFWRFRSGCHECFAMICNSLRLESHFTTRFTAGRATGTKKATTGRRAVPNESEMTVPPCPN